MFRIALATLLFERGRTVAAVLGIAFAVNLFLMQTGTYVGFLESAGCLVRNIGGDIWVMPRGTEVPDYPEPLSPGVGTTVRSIPCVKRARALVFAWVYPRKRDGGVRSAQLVGFEPLPGATVVPWSMVRGLPQDLRAPDRVALDEFDLDKFQIQGDPLGQSLEVLPGRRLYIAGLTRGIRSFTLAPYLFADLATARRMSGLAGEVAHYWTLDLDDPSCADDVIRAVESHRELRAMRTVDFRVQTEKVWVEGAGIGAALFLAAALGLVVAIVVLSQTLYSITTENLRELGTLKALGALNREVLAFVLWQAALLGVVGGVTGMCLAVAVSSAIERYLAIPITWGLLAVGGVVDGLLCAVASVAAVRRVLNLEPAEVFR